MRLYRGTTLANAQQVAENGFHDLTSNFGLYSGTTGEPVNTTGVFFSDLVLDENEGICSEAYFLLEIPDQHLASYEWVEEGKAYREWCIPAVLANSFFTDRTIYSWEAVPERGANARDENRGQPDAAFEGYPIPTESSGPALSLARDLCDAMGKGFDGQAQAISWHLEELSDRTLLFSAAEFAANLKHQELEELQARLDQILGWLATLREKFP